jgi:hypothetical protein
MSSRFPKRRRANKEKDYPDGTDIRIFTPGYIGHLDKEEYTFLRTELMSRHGLRERWLFDKKAKRLSEFHIRHVAMYGCLHDDDCECSGELRDLKE